MNDEINHDEQREADVQKVCKQLLNIMVDANEHEDWSFCPVCYKNSNYCDFNVLKIKHKPTCAVLIAKDLLTEN